MRAAIYFTPDKNHPITKKAASWLGRDAFNSANTISSPNNKDLTLIKSPARYGYHATIKAPFELDVSYGIDDVSRALANFCAINKSFKLPNIKIGKLGSFFALVPEFCPDELFNLEARTVKHFEIYRAPLSDEDIKRRNPQSLSDRQKDNLTAYGYPYIFEDFRFHMTLTGPIEHQNQDEVEEQLNAYFFEFLGKDLDFDGLALFIEREHQSNFYCHSYFKFAET